MRAIILAGGQGVRLRPYTSLLPKPLVPIGNEFSVLEIIMKQLKNYGFNHVTISLNHMAHLIQAFLGDSSKWGLEIDYSIEDTPLSTIGPLTLIDNLPENFLVMNGDILCDLNYQEFYDHHVKHGNLVTVSTYKRKVKVDYGVIQRNDNNEIVGFLEKPEYSYEVSMGIYCINKSVVDGLKKNTKYGFDDLMLDGIKNSRNYVAKPYDGFWLDLGRPDDYDYCNDKYQELKGKLNL